MIIQEPSSPPAMPTLAQLPTLEPTPAIILDNDTNTSSNTKSSDLNPAIITSSGTLETVDITTITSPIEAVPDQHLLEFPVDLSQDDLLAYMEDLDIEIVNVLPELNRVVVKADTEAIESLSATMIVSAEPDYYAHAVLNLPPADVYYPYQWNMQMIGAPTAWANLPDPIDPIQVAVIDTGVCFDHPDMQGIFTDFRWDYVEADNLPQDEVGHGCGVAGVIASQDNTIGIMGVAPFVEIMPLRVLDENGDGVYSDISQAIIDATQNGADIINLSLGGYAYSITMQSAVEYATSQGVYVVAATGNDGLPTPLYPARFGASIAVGAVNVDGEVSSFTNGGYETLAPGEQIIVPYLNQQYVYLSGTSLAAPHVSGIIALELALGYDVTIESGILQVHDEPPPIDPTPTPTTIPTATPNPNQPPYAQTEPIEPQLTDRWIVQLVEGANPDSIAQGLGYENLGAIGTLPNYYVFRITGSEIAGSQSSAVTASLASAPEVISFSQEVMRQYELRVLPSDPLVNDQWHLVNTGQTGGTVGEDINVEPVWDNGFTGTGVTIAVVDNGLQYTHPDIATHYNADGSFDYNSDDEGSVLDTDSDPAPDPDDSHGTLVGGVAAADNDGITCGVGVAYDANLSGIRLIAHPIVESQEIAALTHTLQINDIFNNSWGPSDFGNVHQTLSAGTIDALKNGVTVGRDGKGVIYIFASGNGYFNDDNSNYDGYASSRYTIAVGATDDEGILGATYLSDGEGGFIEDGEGEPIEFYYSEGGANVFINAPSGNLPGLIGTDLLGGDGLNNSSGYSNDCTDDFGGTSGAAPVVSGVIALMLDANPNLTWRDVQYILAETADKNDPTDLSWQTNKAGYETNYYYGFGRVNAHAAIELAKTWTTVGTEIVAGPYTPISNSPVAIPDGLGTWTPDFSTNPNYGSPVFKSIGTPAEQIQFVEMVEVEIELTHDRIGDLAFVLESPEETFSTLALPRRFDGTNGNVTLRMSSKDFWGETALGNWRLHVYDGYAGDTGTFDSWSLTVYGTRGTYLVNTTSDASVNCDAESCSLRGAIQLANAYTADTGNQGVVIVPAGTYTLSRTGAESWSTGDLDITEDIRIIGAGRDQTIIDANGIDRVFDITSPAIIEHLAITGGVAPNAENGGGIRMNFTTSDRLVISEVNIHNNSTTANGGGISAIGTNSPRLILASTELYQNSATNGGGVSFSDVYLYLTDSYIHNNTADNGGGIYDHATSSLIADVQHSTISNNTAIDGGGVHFDSDEGYATFTNMTISGNEATNNGGGVYVENIEFRSNYSTIVNNTADSDNSSMGDGGGIRVAQGGSILSASTIFADNIDLGGEAPDCQFLGITTFSTSNYNIIGDGTGCYAHGTYNNPVFLERDYIGYDPELGVLADNGGTTLTHALPSDSFAVDKGGWVECFQYDVSRLDQRGATRDYNQHCDIGAYEYTGANDPIPLQLSIFTIGDTSLVPGFENLETNGYALPFPLSQDVFVSPGDLVILQFNQMTYDPLGDSSMADATNILNYQLVADGTNGIFDTTSCQATGDDIVVPLDKVANGFSRSVYVLIKDSYELPIDNYRFVACNLESKNRLGLDGNNDGVVGDPVIYDFAVIDQYPSHVTFNTNYEEESELIDAQPISYSPTSVSPVPVRYEFDYAFEYFEAVFSTPVNSAHAEDSNNFLIVDYGADETFQTNSCTVQGDDQQVTITGLSYDGGNNTTTLNIPTPLTNGVYRVIACDTIQNLAGDPIDGDYNFIAGGNHIAEFLLFPKPINLQVQPSGSGIQVTWDDINTSETSFAIQRRVSSTPWHEISIVDPNSTSFDDSDVSCSIFAYHYRIQARRDSDLLWTSYTDDASVQSDCSSVPTPDTLIATSISGTHIDLTWNDNSTRESVYKIERRVSGETFAEIAEVPADTINYADATAVCGVAYDYQVRAYREYTDSHSEYSNIASVTYFCPVIPPTSLTVETVAGESHLNLEWADNSSDETEFRIERSASGAETWVQIASVIANTTTYTDTDVTLGCYTTYDYRVRAFRSDGSILSNPSNVASGTTSCQTITAPTNLSGTGDNDVVALLWDDNSSDEDSFEIQRADADQNNWTNLTLVSANVTTHTDLTTTCGADYDYRVRAIRGLAESAFSNIFTVTQLCNPPQAPSDLTLIALPLSNDIQLDWTDNATTETQFSIERSTDGLTGWTEIATVGQNVTTLTDTDASLSCYTAHHYRVLAYRSDDTVYSDLSNATMATTWCDPDSIIGVPLNVNHTTSDISGVDGFPQSSCGTINHAYVWEFPAINNGTPVNLTTFGSSIDTILSIWRFDGETITEYGCNDDATFDGTSALTGSFPIGNEHIVIVGGKNNASGSVTLNAEAIVTPTPSPIPTNTPVPTPTLTPNKTTVGVYQAGLWHFRDNNSAGIPDLTFRFGANLDAGWVPIVGDWDGDGQDGVGFYKDGQWILRDVAQSGTDVDYRIQFGHRESGWQPVVGDWDGDGDDGLGLFKDGQWLLKNQLTDGTPDHNFRFNIPGNADGIAIAGDWHDQSIDHVGLYHNGMWYLTYSHSNSNNVQVLRYGPADSTWLPIVGDWDEDGDDTIGVFRDGAWRLRNSNSAGNPDLGFSFGSSNMLPIAGYRGELGILSILANTPDDATTISEPTATSIPATSTPQTEATIPVVTDVIEEPTVTQTPTLPATETQTPTVTSTMTPTHTQTPTATVEPPAIPENTSGT